jgi:hypothetical protein
MSTASVGDRWSPSQSGVTVWGEMVASWTSAMAASGVGGVRGGRLVELSAVGGEEPELVADPLYVVATLVDAPMVLIAETAGVAYGRGPVVPDPVAYVVDLADGPVAAREPAVLVTGLDGPADGGGDRVGLATDRQRFTVALGDVHDRTVAGQATSGLGGDGGSAFEMTAPGGQLACAAGVAMFVVPIAGVVGVRMGGGQHGHVGVDHDQGSVAAVAPASRVGQGSFEQGVDGIGCSRGRREERLAW